jgi:hypothetical protein
MVQPTWNGSWNDGQDNSSAAIAVNAMTRGQRPVDQAGRAITVDRKVIEIGGRLYEEAPKNRKRRRTIYPRRPPEGYPLADRVAARIQAARSEQGPTR